MAGICRYSRGRSAVAVLIRQEAMRKKIGLYVRVSIRVIVGVLFSALSDRYGCSLYFKLSRALREAGAGGLEHFVLLLSTKVWGVTLQ
jgi:hypothetical protein